MNYEEQILELKKRIEFLEKKEKKRIAKKKLRIGFEIGKILIIVILFCCVYFNYIKPIKDKMDYVENKISGVETYIEDKLDTLNKFNPFA